MKKPTVEELGRECGKLLKQRIDINWWLAKGEETGDVKFYTVAIALMEIYNNRK